MNVTETTKMCTLREFAQAANIDFEKLKSLAGSNGFPKSHTSLARAQPTYSAKALAAWYVENEHYFGKEPEPVVDPVPEILLNILTELVAMNDKLGQLLEEQTKQGPPSEWV